MDELVDPMLSLKIIGHQWYEWEVLALSLTVFFMWFIFENSLISIVILFIRWFVNI